jgi:hypothetical protein
MTHNGIGCRWVNLGASIKAKTEAILERHQRLSDNRFDFFPAVPQPGTNPFPAKDQAVPGKNPAAA